MIGYLTGAVQSVTPRGVTLVVGGVGYRVEMNARDVARASRGSHAELFCYTHVREDALQLFGFFDEAARDFFEVLIGVSGVGPKSALQVLSLGSVGELRGAIERADTTFLTSIPGIGKKIAERIVLELRGKLPDAGVVAGTPQSLAIAALINLGYTKEDAIHAARDTSGTTEEIIRAALKSLKK